MHDWDAAGTPALIDGVINGRPRKLVSTASRNGYFFTLDRVTGAPVVAGTVGTHADRAPRLRWAGVLGKSGAPEPDPQKEAITPGALVSPEEGGVVNWPPPAFSPE